MLGFGCSQEEAPGDTSSALQCALASEHVAHAAWNSLGPPLALFQHRRYCQPNCSVGAEPLDPVFIFGSIKIKSKFFKEQMQQPGSKKYFTVHLLQGAVRSLRKSVAKKVVAPVLKGFEVHKVICSQTERQLTFQGRLMLSVWEKDARGREPSAG